MLTFSIGSLSYFTWLKADWPDFEMTFTTCMRGVAYGILGLGDPQCAIALLSKLVTHILTPRPTGHKVAILIWMTGALCTISKTRHPHSYICVRHALPIIFSKIAIFALQDLSLSLSSGLFI